MFKYFLKQVLNMSENPLRVLSLVWQTHLYLVWMRWRPVYFAPNLGAEAPFSKRSAAVPGL